MAACACALDGEMNAHRAAPRAARCELLQHDRAGGRAVSHIELGTPISVALGLKIHLAVPLVEVSLL